MQNEAHVSRICTSGLVCLSWFAPCPVYFLQCTLHSTYYVVRKGETHLHGKSPRHGDQTLRARPADAFQQPPTGPIRHGEYRRATAGGWCCRCTAAIRIATARLFPSPKVGVVKHRQRLEARTHATLSNDVVSTVPISSLPALGETQCSARRGWWVTREVLGIRSAPLGTLSRDCGRRPPAYAGLVAQGA